MLKLQVTPNVTRTPVTCLNFMLGACLLLFIHPIPCMAGEIVSQIDEIQSDTEEMKSASEKVLGEDSRIVPIPIPIANPTIGAGLAAALLYLHPKKKPHSPTTTTGVFGMYTDSQS